MSDSPNPKSKGKLDVIRQQVDEGDIFLTLHAQQEMTEESISLEELFEAISSAEVLEDYPRHRRGPCCLLKGTTLHGRDLHIVCTTARPVLIIITGYEPKPPKWETPTRRRQK